MKKLIPKVYMPKYPRYIKNCHMNKVRESNFELLRLIAMFFIVLYHLLLKFIVVVDDNPIFQAVFLPLHVAVICFVLISGYFHIKPSIYGGAKLLFPLLVFYLPLTIYEYSQNNVGIKSLLFFSKSPYWFIRTYFYLFLIAPVLNSFLNTDRRRVSLLLVLGFIAIYMGWMMHDASMADGKNLVLFMFLYILGDFLRHNKEIIDNVSTPILGGFYLFLNTTLIYLYTTYSDTYIGKTIWHVSYPYCSPILILNAVVLFLVFSRLHFKSKAINWLANSVYTIYILHHQHYVLYNLIGPFVFSLYKTHHFPIILIFYLTIYSLAIMSICIIIDKFVGPLQYYFVRYLTKREEKEKMLL